MGGVDPANVGDPCGRRRGAQLFSMNQLARELHRQESGLYNCIASCYEDSTFVTAISALYPGLPVYANLRCGLWYVPPPSPTCYFKSTDGHNSNWSFSLVRLNLHQQQLLARLLADDPTPATALKSATPVTSPCGKSQSMHDTVDWHRHRGCRMGWHWHCHRGHGTAGQAYPTWSLMVRVTGEDCQAADYCEVHDTVNRLQLTSCTASQAWDPTWDLTHSQLAQALSQGSRHSWPATPHLHPQPSSGARVQRIARGQQSGLPWCKPGHTYNLSLGVAHACAASGGVLVVDATRNAHKNGFPPSCPAPALGTAAGGAGAGAESGETQQPGASQESTSSLPLIEARLEGWVEQLLAVSRAALQDLAQVSGLCKPRAKQPARLQPGKHQPAPMGSRLDQGQEHQAPPCSPDHPHWSVGGNPGGQPRGEPNGPTTTTSSSTPRPSPLTALTDPLPSAGPLPPKPLTAAPSQAFHFQLQGMVGTAQGRRSCLVAPVPSCKAQRRGLQEQLPRLVSWVAGQLALGHQHGFKRPSCSPWGGAGARAGTWAGSSSDQPPMGWHAVIGSG
ncbi:initiator tRNA phosphoribosyl transferase-domain-containing protein [Haematococcus lacustris]